MKNLIDIVYPLGGGSRWNNNEIRYSLRSIEQYATGYRHIFIVGLKPAWLSGVKHIEATDPLEFNADGNIAMKVLKACADPRVSETFLFINDDHLFLKPCDIREFPYYYKGDLSRKPESYYKGGLYLRRLKRTRDVLKSKGLPTLHFDIHTPILINKKLFPGIIEQFNFRDDIGYTMKSLYANSLRIEGIYRRDLNIKQICTAQEIEKMVDGQLTMAFNNGGISGGLKLFLKNKFPEISNFEIMEKKQQILYTEVENWLQSPEKDYNEGVRLYVALGKDRHLMGLLKRSSADRMRAALEKHLQAIKDKMQAKGMKSISKEALAASRQTSKPAETKKEPAKKPVKRSGKVKVDANPYVELGGMPENLQLKYRRNQEIMPELSAYHEKMKAVPEGEENNPTRKEFAQKIADLENEKNSNWQEIDEWWKQHNENNQPSKPTGKLSKDQIEKIEDAGVRALSKEKRIDANKNYIKRYKDSKGKKQVEEVALRIRELQEWGVELK